MATLDQLYVRVEAPPVVPHPYGLFSVAAPVTPGEPNWQTGVTWESWACLDPNTTTDQCINGGAAPAAKEFEACPDTRSYKPITVYIGIKRNGQSMEVGSEQANTVLAGGEEYAIEKFLLAQLAAAVTEAAALSPLGALAAVEMQLGQNYMGTGVIHMSRETATRLSAQLVRNGDHIETLLGTPVAVGAGYAGTPVIYGTGAVAVRRGGVDIVSAWNTKINDELVLAERTYVVGWDCYATGVLVAPAT
jgi:hypothetical protein